MFSEKDVRAAVAPIQTVSARAYKTALDATNDEVEVATKSWASCLAKIATLVTVQSTINDATFLPPDPVSS
jgi:hypothetical protein